MMNTAKDTKVRKCKSANIHKFRIQYRRCGVWINDITAPTRKIAEQYARLTGREFQVIPLR